MTSRWEATQVSADFRQDDLSSATSHARDRLQLCQGCLLLLLAQHDLLGQPIDLPIGDPRRRRLHSR